MFSEAIRKDLRRLATHVDSRAADGSENQEPGLGVALDDVLADWRVGTTTIAADRAADLRRWLDSVMKFVDEKDASQDQRHSRLLGYVQLAEDRDAALRELNSRLPVLVYFNNYFRVRPNLHLRRFADRVEQNILDDDQRNDPGTELTAMTTGICACSSCSASMPGNSPTSDALLIQGTIKKHSTVTAASLTSAASGLTPPAFASPATSARSGTPTGLTLKRTPC